MLHAPGVSKHLPDAAGAVLVQLLNYFIQLVGIVQFQLHLQVPLTNHTSDPSDSPVMCRKLKKALIAPPAQPL